MIRRLSLTKLVAVTGLWMCLGTSAQADEQADRIKALEQRLESSVQLIEKLSARVAELERGDKAKPAKMEPGAPADQAQALAALQESVAQMSDGLGKRGHDTGLPLHGFADVGAARSTANDPQPLKGFNIGTLELYLTPQFGSRVKSLFELAFEFNSEGHAELELERLQLGYTFSDSLTLWAGRFHTPFGLWNTAFHHGANLQTSIYRPRFIDFEDKGGIIPAHSVGLWASGKTALGPGRMLYDAYLTNGPRITDSTLDFNAFTDDNTNKMVGGNLGYQPSGGLTGLTVGMHAFGSTVDAYSTTSTVMSATRLRMAGAYFGYDAADWEVIGEYYRFANADVNSGEIHRSSAWFLQAGRFFGLWMPYARYEHVSLDPNDNYFISQQTGRSYKRAVLGVRYLIDARSALKFELIGTNEAPVMLVGDTGAPVPFAGARYGRAAIQYSIAF
jgi:hypothetical protein